MRVLVTGASGFVGSALLKRLADQGHEVRGAYRRGVPSSLAHVDGITVGELGKSLDWRTALDGVVTVVHTAARVHIVNENNHDPLAEFRRVNVDGTGALAHQAAVAGVRRFVFLSSVKVNGELTKASQPFTSNDVSAPGDAYGVSKYEAEQLVRQIAVETGMEVVIIRPPLVYGPGVKANFYSMMRWLSRGIPLPLAAITQNRRSLVALDNLLDLILTCLNHPAAANQTFMVSDGEDLSTAELLRRMGAAMGHPARLFYLPPEVLKLGAAIFRKPEVYQRLCGSLQLDIDKTRQMLGWIPPVSVDDGLRRAAEGFRS